MSKTTWSVTNPRIDPALAFRPFISTCIVPAQFFRNAASACDRPEKRLMLAIIEDAWNTIIRPNSKKREQRLRKEAEDWFLADDLTYIY